MREASVNPLNPQVALPDLDQPNQTVVILGAARSGVAAAHFLHKRSFRVFVSDAGTIAPELQAELERAQIPYEAAGHREESLKKADFMVASPGIPLHARPYQLAQQYAIPVISEIELAQHFNRHRLIAVTGSNGKSTTVTLLNQLLIAAGYRSACGGNIGTPLISLIEQELDFVVLEISSFQLETTYSLCPEIAILLNLYENHLDRHQTMEAYFAAKTRLFQTQSPGEHALLNADNPWCQKLAPKLSAQIHWFGLNAPQKTESRQAHLDPKTLYYRQQALMPLTALALQGQHNRENILAALTAAAILELPAKVCRQVLERFSGIPHRLEKLGQWQGRSFINDSKATNYLAALTALESLEPPTGVILIAGGLDKGGDFAPLAKMIQQRVKHVVLMGHSGPNFQQWLTQTGYNQSTVVADMQAAVQLAYAKSSPGDIVLLSPATASYDQYQNFEERGEDFRHHVAALFAENPKQA